MTPEETLTVTPEERLIDELSEKNEDAAALARVVSLAVLVEPQLLRRARIELLPGADAGAEADLWLSPLVQARGPRGITLLPRAAERLREQLAEDPDLFEKAVKLTAEVHAASPPTIRLEEEINRLYASPGGRSLEEIEGLLRSAVNTLVSYAERRGLAHWAAGALTRLPEGVRTLEPARMLAAAAYMRLSSYVPADSVKAPGGAMPEWLPWVAPRYDAKEGQFRLGVRLVEGGVHLGGPAEGENWIPVPDTSPLLVELSWPALEGEGRRVRQVRLEKGEQLRVEAPRGAVLLRTVTGDCYELSPRDEAAPEPPPEPEARGVCFVSMPFGEKIDFRTGRKLNLDAAYRVLIKPAVEEAGLECVRADEIAHSGVIDVPIYEQLLKADIVISDLSTSNPGVFYELGVRHALRPHATILISEDQAQFPFEIADIVVRKYKHLGEDIGYGESRRFTAVLRQAIVEIYNREPRLTDSPVYAYLEDLTPPHLADEAEDMTEAAPESSPSKSSAPETSAPGTSAQGGDAKAGPLYGELMRRAEGAKREGDFATARSLLSQLRSTEGAAEDPYVIQQLALVTYKSGQPTPRAALEEARDLLLALDPATSNDTETLGLWGAVHKRLWDETKERKHLDEAVRGYKRGFYLRNDYYNGINLAYLLNVRAADSRPSAASSPHPVSHAVSADDRAEAIADFVQAERVRREVAEICEQELRDGDTPEESRYWLLATLAEALLGSGRAEEARGFYEQASSLARERWMIESTNEQREKLERLLSDSPLKYLRDYAS